MVGWKKLPQTGQVPIARSSHGIASVSDGIVLFGGEHAPRQPIDNETYIYNMKEGVWSVLQTTGAAPCPRVGATVCAIGETVYVFGGRTEVAEGSSLNDLYTLDVKSCVWKKLEPNGLLPPRRNYHTMAVYKGNLLIFGGCGDAGRLNDLWQYDVGLNAWHDLPSSDAIKGRGGAGIAVSGDKLWIVAGFGGTELGDVHSFDFEKGTWSCPSCCSDAHKLQDNESQTLPKRSVFGIATHQAATGCCGHDSHIVVFGGEVEPSSEGHAGAGNFSNKVYCFDGQEQRWHTLTFGDGESPIPCGWLAATSCNEGIVMHGGINSKNERLDSLWLLQFH